MSQLCRFVLLPLVLSLVGCIRVGDFSRHAMRYNEAVEEAQNKMLLLNIVRANRHQPMYLTDVTTITGNLKLDFSTGGIETDYGLHGARTLTSGKLAPSLEYANSPSFNVNVLSHQEFMNGFLKPTSNELVAYYWDQRWEQELLLYLFVHKVIVRSVKDKEAKPEEYENYPIIERGEGGEDDLLRVNKFGHWVTKFLQKEPFFTKQEVNIGPCLDASKISDLHNLVAITKAGLSLTEVEPGRYQLLQPKPELNMMSKEEAARAMERDAICKRAKGGDQSPLKAAADIAIKECEGKEPMAQVCDYRKKIYDQIKNGEFKCIDPCTSSKTEQGGQISVTSEDKETTLFLRSPEGILYYLGELMRVEEEKGFVPEICIEGKLEPLFVAFAKTWPGHDPAPNCPSTVAVQYEGSEFIIPHQKPTPLSSDKADKDEFQCPKRIGDKDYKEEENEGRSKYLKSLEKLQCSPGRSMQALSLLTQLISLQKSAKETPTTTIIRAIQ